MFSRLAALFRLRALARCDTLDDRAAVLTLFARFTDELCSGLLVVLMPALRAGLGLSVQQVGWCFQAMFSVAAVVEPLNGAAIDLVRRRPLLVAGATGWGAALLLAADAPSFGWLLAAFALVGVAAGPLAHTADVVLIEGRPTAEERVSSRFTILDTTGALLAPSAVALAGWGGVDERLLLAVTGSVVLGYALLLAGTVVPAPAPRANGPRAPRQAWANVREVLADPQARRWIGMLVLIDVLDVPEAFEPVWLSDIVGASQPLVAVHVAAGTDSGLVALVVLDRWLADHDATPVLMASCVAILVLYPTWLLVPGFVAKLVLVVLRDAAQAPLWPVLHARALAAVPGKGGTVSALTALLSVLPLHAGFGWLAERAGLTSAMLWVHLAAVLGLVGLLRRATGPSRVLDRQSSQPKPDRDW